jgi:hypothetical protein
VRRIAIFDFDVHHGNGTEAIIRGLYPSEVVETVPLQFATGAFSTMVYRPWLDASDGADVMFVSSHGYGKRDPGAWGWQVMHAAEGCWQRLPRVCSPQATWPNAHCAADHSDADGLFATKALRTAAAAAVCLPDVNSSTPFCCFSLSLSPHVPASSERVSLRGLVLPGLRQQRGVECRRA